jgi:hypothetical protein
MRITHISSIAGTLLGLALIAATPVSAAPIKGTATITGFDTIDGTSLTNNTLFDFTDGVSVSPSATGDLATFVIGATATLNVDPWTFTPFATESPFLTITNGADSVVFDLDTSTTITDRSGNATASSMTLYLLGTLTPSGPDFAGLTASAASLRFAATAAGTTGGYTISLAAPPAPVSTPEPLTVALFGGGLIGMGVLRRRKQKA